MVVFVCFFYSSRCKHSSHRRLGVSVERAVEVGKRVVTRVNIKTTVPAPLLGLRRRPELSHTASSAVGGEGGGVFVFLALSEGIGSVNTLESSRGQRLR